MFSSRMSKSFLLNFHTQHINKWYTQNVENNVMRSNHWTRTTMGKKWPKFEIIVPLLKTFLSIRTIASKGCTVHTLIKLAIWQFTRVHHEWLQIHFFIWVVKPHFICFVLFYWFFFVVVIKMGIERKENYTKTIFERWILIGKIFLWIELWS